MGAVLFDGGVRHGSSLVRHHSRKFLCARSIKFRVEGVWVLLFIYFIFLFKLVLVGVDQSEVLLRALSILSL